MQDEPYAEGDGYLDSESGFYDDVYGDYVFDEAEAQTSTCAVDELTGKLQLTGAVPEPSKACTAVYGNSYCHSRVALRPRQAAS